MRFLDPSRSQCTSCKDSFTTTNRKHWCRRCGRIFCDACTQKRQQLYTAGPFLRVCRTCSAPVLFQLPIGLLQRVFSYFSDRTLSCALATCKRFQLGVNVPFQEIRNIHDFYDKEATRYLQKGAFGSVYAAELIEDRQRAAIKVIDKYNVHTLREWAFIRREIELHQTLKHPNVVELRHVYQTRSKVYIVMELGNGDLFDYMMKKGFMTEREVTSIAAQLLSALDYLHNVRHVVHRDIKPENVLVFSPPAFGRSLPFGISQVVVKLCDLGLAKSFPHAEGPRVVSNTPCGTLNYCPPEVLSKKTETTTDKLTKLDIFSLGIVLHVLISGVEPFHGRTPGDLLRSMRRPVVASGPEWANVSAGLRRLVLDMLEYSSHRRPTAREALAKVTSGFRSPAGSPSSHPKALSPASHPQALSPPEEPPQPPSPVGKDPCDDTPLVDSEQFKGRVAQSLRKEFDLRFDVDDRSGGLVPARVDRPERRRCRTQDQIATEDQLLGMECLAESYLLGLSPQVSPAARVRWEGDEGPRRQHTVYGGAVSSDERQQRFIEDQLAISQGFMHPDGAADGEGADASIPVLGGSSALRRSYAIPVPVAKGWD
eukprot:TRINITY_DN10289_c0_g4_i1.p1 TRINITY_DN10289_c0_g4~~TRINITY_DN10289_c0_g4_i1.p1  ORF type:complete len:597 (+),score=168.89 TRINITY_DN10289_c0_g4_i1:366-2156(+)